MRFGSRHLLAGLVACSVVATAAGARATDEDPADFLPGLRAEYRGQGGVGCTRVDEAIAFSWGAAKPDERLPSGEFSARWSGRLLCVQPGEHRLHVFAAGNVRVALAGNDVIEGISDEPRWLASEPVKLEFGLHPLEIEFSKTSDQARIALFWSGPGFTLEPIAERHLFHAPADNDAKLGRFDRGRLLARALRCDACHVLPVTAAEPLAGPSLKHLRGNIEPEWLSDWIAQAGHHVASAEKDAGESHIVSRMPDFGLAREDAAAIAAYLLAGSEPLPPATKRPPAAPRGEGDGDEKQKQPRLPSAAEGELLFHSLGCLACHRVGSLGEVNLFGGGDLSQVAHKRPPEFFERWLRSPETLNPRHRMPVFPLHEIERKDLAAYLATLGKNEEKEGTGGSGGSREEEQVEDGQMGEEKLVAHGTELARQYRCGACHELPGGAERGDASDRLIETERLSSDSRWAASCLGEPGAEHARPGYRLGEADQAAIREYVSLARAADGGERRSADGTFALQERNCLACHARGLGEGIEPLLTPVTDRFEQLRAVQAAMKPPALHGVGDKLHEQALRDAISIKHAPLRPWLKVRMPRFDLAAEESAALIEHLIEHDRIPQGSPFEDVAGDKEEEEEGDAERRATLAGSRLVTADGFGCTSCHGIGEVASAKAELKSRGPNLALLGRRVRREWYDRFLPSPARIVPRMEMPSIVAPVRGVLDDDLPAQLDAVWRVLNTPGFTPPPADPERIVRLRNVGDMKERAAILTDVIEVGEGKAKRTYVKPLIIGLPNRHNVLFDLETNQLAAWWIGDVARQRTRGKSWYWEPAGTMLYHAPRGGSDFASFVKAEPRVPILRGQFATEFDSFEIVDGGVRFHHRLRLRDVADEAAFELSIVQTFTAARGDDQETGVRRHVVIDSIPADQSIVFEPIDRSAGPQLSPDRSSAIIDDAPRSTRLKVLSEGPWFNAEPGELPFKLFEPHGKDERIEFTIDYLTTLPVDSFPVDAPPQPLPPTRKLHVVPGYEATELSLPVEIMPTALAWRKDGTLVIASLNGQVWLAKDRDADGMEDSAASFSDDLAAPYGLGINDDSIDVLNKYALLRLYDLDDDGRADRTETIASGWGHTADYHDWAVGLPRDKQGNYYVAVPCEQDGRSAAAAYLRGTALKLTPREPTSDSPHRFSLEVLCGGLRFPMGLALSKDGELFASDNQGNYNPFNELNHLQPGKRYGFINSLERKQKEFNPPLEPPAIDIPHPWTRSVNGICFLSVGQASGLPASPFGPFEGHLIGCEYDTRRLVRMSLEKVGDTYQGAVYPFTLDPVEGRDALQGPVVCAVSPRGDLYVGNMRDSGWGGGSNVGSLVRLRRSAGEHGGELPCGIAEVRVAKDGFVIHFTGPVDETLGRDPAGYAISSYRRISTPEYGGPDVDRTIEKISSVTLSPDRMQATLQLDRLREGFVYEFRLKHLSPGDAQFHPAEAHYTLRKKR